MAKKKPLQQGEFEFRAKEGNVLRGYGHCGLKECKIPATLPNGKPGFECRCCCPGCIVISSPI